MQVVIFQGGLGNQLHEYVFYCYLRNNYYPRIRYYFRKYGSHYGFELPKWFNVSLREVPWFISLYIKVIDKLHSLRLIRRKGFITEDDFKPQFNRRSKFVIFDGYWQDIRYNTSNIISFKNNLPLSSKNTHMIDFIRNNNCVSLHIRRGDYLKQQNIGLFTCLSETNYYQNAINYFLSKDPLCFFIVFSDEIDWCKSRFNDKNFIYVDWNEYEDSPLDMYLMSLCNHNIIANSSFSYWAARLNNNNNVVIYPKNWHCFQHPLSNLIPKEWIEF